MEWYSVLIDSGKDVLSAVFPENIYCMCCGDAIDPSVKSGLCSRCAEKMPWALDNPFHSYMDEFAFDDLLPCVRYGSYARRIMNGLKNGGQNYMAESVGRMLAERLQLSWDMPDVLAAVPSHKSKLQRRGYNQAELLAEAAAKYLKLPYQKGLLVKTRATGSMRMADGRTRRSMLEDSFAIAPRFEDAVAGKHVCLVDDVVTTGSTADACARVLKAAGAAKVSVLCFGASSGVRKSRADGGEDEIF